GGDQARIRTPLSPGLHHETLLINRDRHQARTRGEKGTPRAKVAGILHPDGLTRIEQRARRQVKRTLGAGGDDDLLGNTTHSASDANLCGNSLPQWIIASRRLVVCERMQRLPGAARDQPRPDLERKAIQRRLTAAKGPADWLLDALRKRHVLERADT